MGNTFKVSVNDKQTFELGDKELKQIDALATGVESYHVLQECKPFMVEIVNSDFDKKKYTLKVNNNRYAVAIADNLDMQIKEMGFSLASSKNVSSILAPMPGLILEIIVSEGQEVKEGDQLIILEAMKMENIITSPRDGIVKSIAVKKGEAVEKQRLLIEFE